MPALSIEMRTHFFGSRYHIRFQGYASATFAAYKSHAPIPNAEAGFIGLKLALQEMDILLAWVPT
jgi:hypothetical protein